MMRVFFLMAALLMPIVAQAQAPCTRGSSRLVIGGVDLDAVRCQIAMMTTGLGNLETALAAAQAQLALRESDLKDANGKVSWWEKCAADSACVTWVFPQKTSQMKP